MRAWKRTLVVVSMSFFLASAGCSGLLGSSESLSFSAEPATIDSASVADAGFELANDEEIVVHRDLEAGGNETNVTITNRVHVYNKEVRSANVSFVLVLSTPKIEIGGQPMNPMGTMDTESLLDRAVDHRADVRGVEHDGSWTAPILGENRTVERFHAVARIDDRDVNVTLHLTRIPHGDDYVIAVGVYPREYDGKSDVRMLFEGIEHSAA